MKSFLERFGTFILGVLHGLDRLRFRGNMIQLCHSAGMMNWLWKVQIPLKEYKLFARDKTIALCQAIEGPAERAGLYRFLNSSNDSKEKIALQLAAEQGRTEGLIAVLGCVEPCRILQVRGNHRTHRLELHVEPGKCKHYYHYYLDPVYGLRYTRLQTWFPFTTHAGLNGRDWLAQLLNQAGIAFTKEDNCFPWIADFAAAQTLADAQLSVDWPTVLDGWVRQSNPWADTLLPCPVPYHWSVETAEYATDFAFRSAEDLGRIYPLLVRQAIFALRGEDVLRFFGHRLRRDGRPRANLPGEVTTRVEELNEGTRVAHEWLRNLLKIYDKFGIVLRLETLLRDLRSFWVYRAKQGEPDGPKAYRPLRQGVADLQARAELSQQVNERYATALATVKTDVPLGQLAADLGKRVEWHGRSARALNPLAAADVALLEAVSRGDFEINGFRNRDIRCLLYGDDAGQPEAERRRRSAKVTRLLRLLRGHGVIDKIANTHRYLVTEKGRRSLAALLAARQATTEQLLQAA